MSWAKATQVTEQSKDQESGSDYPTRIQSKIRLKLLTRFKMFFWTWTNLEWEFVPSLFLLKSATYLLRGEIWKVRKKNKFYAQTQTIPLSSRNSGLNLQFFLKKLEMKACKQVSIKFRFSFYLLEPLEQSHLAHEESLKSQTIRKSAYMYMNVCECT